MIRHKPITNSTSCSTSRIASPSLARRSKSAARSSDSLSSRPEDGSSREQQARLHSERASELDETCLSRRQLVGSHAGDAFESDTGQDLVRYSSRIGSVTVPVLEDLGRHADVVARRHRTEHLETLECAADTEPCALVRLQPGDVLVV